MRSDEDGRHSLNSTKEPKWVNSPTNGLGRAWREVRSNFVGRSSTSSSQTMCSVEVKSIVDGHHNTNALYCEPELLQHGGRFTISEDTKFRKVWSLLLAVMLIYVGTLLPYKLVFREFRVPEPAPDTLAWSIATWIVDIFFWVGLIINFFLSYRDCHGREVTSLSKIAKRYLTHGFLVDLMSCMPPQAFEALLSQISQKGKNSSANKAGRLTKLRQLPKLTKIIRVLRLAKIFTFFRDSDLWRKMQEVRGFKEINFIIGFLVVAHLLACGWYLVASLHGPDVVSTWIYRREWTDNVTYLSASPEEQWLHALYFVITVFTTVGFGDISACTVAEIVYAILTMIVGTITNSIIFAQIINVMQTSDNLAVQRDEQASLIKSFTEHTQLAPATAHKFLSFIKRTASVHRGYDRERVKLLMSRSVFPRELEGELPRALFRGELMRNKMLRVMGVSYIPVKLPLYIALAVHQRFLVRGDLVYCCGDLPSGIHLVLNGVFAGIAMRKGSSGLNMRDDSGKLDEFVICDAKNKTQRRESHCFPDDFFIYQIFCRRSYFGDQEVLFNYQARRTSIRCESDGAMLVFDKHDLLELTSEFPLYVKSMRKAVRRRQLHSASLFKINKKLFHRVEDVAASSIQRAYQKYIKQRKTFSRQKSFANTVKQLSHLSSLATRNEVQRIDDTKVGGAQIEKLESQMNDMRKDLCRLEAHMCNLTSMLQQHLGQPLCLEPLASAEKISEKIVI